MQSGKKYKFFAKKSDINLRLDRFLASQLSYYSRSFLQKIINNGLVHVNSRIAKASYKVQVEDLIEVEIPPPEPSSIEPEDIPLNIVYEDSHLLVLNKPAGLVVHPGAGVRQGTLVNALMHHCQNLSGVGGKMRPGIVHRLDKNTSGLLVVAKDDRTHVALQEQFSEKTAYREYKAIVWGLPKDEAGTIEAYLNRSKSNRKKFVVAKEGKSAITHYQVENYYSFLSLLRVWLKTGRTHQIRAHFQYLNHPVLGDAEYSGRHKQVNRLSSLSDKKFALYLLSCINRQALHAFRLEFVHPIENKKMEFTAPLAEDMEGIIRELNKLEGRS